MLGKMKGGVLFGGFFSPFVVAVILFSTGLSYSANIDEINRAIQSRGLNWVAGETPLSNLTFEEMKKLASAMEEADSGMAADPSFYIPASLPSSLDWTNNGGNYVTGVRNQGSCGSCWAFATTAALESKALITFNTPNQNLDLSEQIILSCTDSLAPSGDSKPNNCEKGGFASTAADVLKNYGTALESCYPYTQADGSCGSACTSWQNDTYKIDGWSYVVNGSGAASASAIKTALQSGPVVGWMKVYDDLYSYVSGVYARTSTNYVGNHFILIVGYDDNKGAFEIKNSWGTTNWGQSGFGWIAYSELYPGGDPVHTQFGRWVYAFGNAVHTSPPTPQCYLSIGFDVTLSGKDIDDGYISSNFTTDVLNFDICLTGQGNTTDSFEGYLYDQSNDYWQVAGTVIWNSAGTSAYIQGVNNQDGSMSYIDGTIKYSKGKYSISAKGGCSDGASFIESYSSVKGSGYELSSDKGAAGESLKNRKNKIQSSGKLKSNRVFK